MHWTSVMNYQKELSFTKLRNFLLIWNLLLNWHLGLVFVCEPPARQLQGHTQLQEDILRRQESSLLSGQQC